VSRSHNRLLEQPFELNGETVQIGASIGIAVFPEDASAMESLCVMADVRMYADKQTSRNRRRVESMQPALPLPFPAVKAQTGLNVPC
jgi:predicted signal transduction protein with EAL and GGDEF domain